MKRAAALENDGHARPPRRDVFRESDVVARLGGDEFAALAGECEAAGLSAIQARLQTAFETFNATGLEFRIRTAEPKLTAATRRG